MIYYIWIKEGGLDKVYCRCLVTAITECTIIKRIIPKEKEHDLYSNIFEYIFPEKKAASNLKIKPITEWNDDPETTLEEVNDVCEHFNLPFRFIKDQYEWEKMQKC